MAESLFIKECPALATDTATPKALETSKVLEARHTEKHIPTSITQLRSKAGVRLKTTVGPLVKEIVEEKDRILKEAFEVPNDTPDNNAKTDNIGDADAKANISTSIPAIPMLTTSAILMPRLTTTPAIHRLTISATLRLFPGFSYHHQYCCSPASLPLQELYRIRGTVESSQVPAQTLLGLDYRVQRDDVAPLIRCLKDVVTPYLTPQTLECSQRIAALSRSSQRYRNGKHCGYINKANPPRSARCHT